MTEPFFLNNNKILMADQIISGSDTITIGGATTESGVPSANDLHRGVLA
jgi:hypothetical protein